MHNILEKMFMFLFLFSLCAVTMLIFQTKRIISSETWFKSWVGRTTLNGDKKEDGLTYKQVVRIWK